jgi:transposase
MVYEGSLSDVRTRRTKLAMTSGLDLTALTVIMDKGFYSSGNVDLILDEEDSTKFLVAVPFTSGFAKKLIMSEHKDIDTPENTIAMPEGNIRGITKLRTWEGRIKTKVYAHVSTMPSCRTSLGMRFTKRSLDSVKRR